MELDGLDVRCKNTVHGLLNAVPVVQSLQNWMILAHMVMNDAGATQTRVAGMGLWQRQANKAWQGKHGTGRCSTNRPACEAGRPLVSFLVGLEGVRWCWQL